ncbi:MAG: DUF3800 domain-containing protein [Bifidobacteriaceae bacterium]|nr:DUF3800 domain-containing protein [Bifidobacteriaceae bacterium]
MHVFVDDSGDPGFKLGHGSSRFLVMAACVFDAPEDMEDTADAIHRCRRGLGRSDRFEFKYAKTPWPQKDAFFRAVAPCRFWVRAIIIDKTLVTSGHLRVTPSHLKNYAIRQLLTHTFGIVREAKLVIDGKDSKAFGITESRYFMREVNQVTPGTLRKVAHADSRANVLIQLADMVAGAIHRSERTDRRDAAGHMRVILAKTRQPHGSIWRFT